ncbi:phage gp6-like head-tail connector protein [Paenibacillus sp. MWE-103]|uniref:Phage gp6-like head-tail connector protein n=1 Tax=Paenibacillus artemisiicola TaxID=1172618 RepID=A0ABS3WGI1_9BACL|nr:head-tail connector protein [Paenibacillus artemisiicola]MBO7747358.1 phage gp6-like head-tail connector protein [Paenibacillus artemisiicola]
MNNEITLSVVKAYLRIDYDYEDFIIEGLIGAAKQFLLKAGVQPQSDNELYNLVVKMLVSLFYENRNAAEGDLKIPAIILHFITQLSAGNPEV